MNLHQYIVETTLNKADMNKFEVIWNTLWKECQPFLKEMKKIGGSRVPLIYRGTHNPIGDFKNIKPRKDREPKDMPQELHDELVSLFHQKFKWGTRSEGVFVSGSRGQAGNYGPTYLFFPVGKYKFIWSPKIEDLYSYFDGSGYLNDEFDGYNAGEEWEHEYGEGNRGTWYYDGNDTGESYYENAYQEVHKHILDDPEDFDESLLGWQPDMTLEDYEDEQRDIWENSRKEVIKDAVDSYTDKNLKNAILSRYEITFKCKSYYLVNVKYEYILKEYIKNNGQMPLPLKWEDYKFLPQYLQLISDMRLDEGKTYDFVKSLGRKLGLKIERSDSIFKYIKDFGKGMDDIIRLSSLYLITDITDFKSRKIIAKDIKKVIKNTNRKKLVAFMLMLDKDTLGITTHFRHLLHSVFGVEVSSYDNWLEDIEYMKKELKNIKVVLKRMGNTEKELAALKQFNNIILNMENIGS